MGGFGLSVLWYTKNSQGVRDEQNGWSRGVLANRNEAVDEPGDAMMYGESTLRYLYGLWMNAPSHFEA